LEIGQVGRQRESAQTYLAGTCSPVGQP
jgi:hypothetical protein